MRTTITAAAAAAAASAVVGLAALGGAGPARAASLPARALPSSSTNWAGYYATAGTRPVYMAEATITVPRDASCKGLGWPTPERGSYWAGIGGMPEVDGKAVSLEQDGVEVYCRNRHATPEFALFWEVYPDTAASNHVHYNWAGTDGKPVGHVIDVQPGDTVIADVLSPGWFGGHPGKYGLRVTVNPPTADNPAPARTGTYFAWRAILPGYTGGTTVEAITEWETCSSLWNGRPVGDFTAGVSPNCGLPRLGTPRFAGGYLTRLPGDPKPAPVPVTQHPLTMRPLMTLWAPVYPGKPEPADQYDSQHTGFVTHWNGWGWRWPS
jgi:hypothetical protein